ncbi:MAG: glycosyltransferase [Patescibacteria group bacterium]|nr:glycosyltransferase [Patescibacteria group bacterium]
MKIALVHDFLKEYGGAERVLEALHKIWPEAPVYTSFVDWKGLGPHSQRLGQWNIKTSWAQKIPFFTKVYSPLRFLAPLFFESFDFSGFDLVISSCNAYYAKGIITRPETVHICYCHTPPRSLYGYATRMDWRKNPIINIYGQLVNHYLRKYDFLASQRVNFFIANSQAVKQRIKKFYRREAEVIYPPVELGFRFQVSGFSKKKLSKTSDLKPDSYYLYVGKLAAAKNVNLAIEAANKLGFKLKIVGKGGEEEGLKKLVSYSSSKARNLKLKDSSRPAASNNKNIEFLGEVNDEELINLYQNCQAVIFPAVDEDFGIVPVEAMSFGKPVVALKSGGVVETVADGKTGVFFDKPDVDELVKAIKKLEKLKIKPEDCRQQAEKFSPEVFQKKIREFVQNKIK